MSVRPDGQEGPASPPGPGKRGRAGGPGGRSGVAAERTPRRGHGEAAAADPLAEPRLAPVRLAPRDELAVSARVAPLLRAARELARWLGQGRRVDADGALLPGDAAVALAGLELSPAELDAAWKIAAGTRMLVIEDRRAASGPALDVLAEGDAEEVLALWDKALTLMLGAEDLDGIATALYTVGGPVKMDALFEAYVSAAGARERPSGSARDGDAGSPGGGPGHGRDHGQDNEQDHDLVAGLSAALEALADLAVVELGTEEGAGGLTVALSRLGVWGMHRRLRAQGWHVPVLGNGSRGDAAALLATLASCDIEDGESEIAAWLSGRRPDQAAAELVDAAGRGSPGLRGAAFAVLDRIGADAVPAVRAALGHPMLRAHAAVWLHEHGEEADLGPGDRAWLLVDLGAGLLEEADARDVVAELLPDVPPEAQAELVAGLWDVSHPGLTDLLTTLSEHHPDPAVARAARKAAFKARSRPAGPGD